MQSISEKIVAGLEPKLDQHGKPRASTLHYFSGATLQGKKAPAGFAVRVTAAGTKAFVLFHRKDGKGYLETLGRWDANAQGGSLTVRDAIVKADRLVKDFTKGNREDPRPERTRRLQDGDKLDGLKIGGAFDPDADEADREQKHPGLLDMFVDRYCRKEAQLKSADQYASTFRRLVAPDIGDLPVFGEGRLRRSHVVDMLDEIEDENGPVMADRTLAYLRKAFNWFQAREEDFTNPIVKGIRQVGTNSRDRVLADDQLRDLWTALDLVENVPACYPRFVKSLLLTTTRRTEAALMHSSELDGDDWTIPADRYKTGIDHIIPLSAAARELIGEKPAGANGNSWFIFTTTQGAKGFSGFSKAKRELDKAIAKVRAEAGREPMPHWVLHDLRRTGRSLMSRAGVSADHAERCLGHVIGGVRGVYDRYAYLDEKRAAFEALASLVDKILSPTANVEELAARRVQA
ncbi:tyrosine-type recombinase/integrase [Bradyrhizobium cytisi]|uniref:Site-specific integrase n=1 Tax=Bradyrhizobium cytisi TaxID=515489 RepID=A0A5S4X0D0_9BRAD|nr:site-specific integrase [Bradyrhizobium cytisi]TYL87802.1 site-specific integrase [Bradyrhizobium cytisi]